MAAIMITTKLAMIINPHFNTLFMADLLYPEEHI
jgi:hypothetical protein